MPLPVISILLSMLPACGSSDSPKALAGASSSGGAAGSANPTGGGTGTGASNGTGGAPGGGSMSVPSAGASTGGTSPGIPPLGDACAPLPMSGKVVEITEPSALVSTVYDAAAGTTFLLADGTYPLGGKIVQVRADNITLRSKSGNREAVILDGQWDATSGEIVAITGSHVTIADLTISRAYTHAIHVQTTDTTDTVGTLIFNVHVIDALQQGIKINLNAAVTHFPDDGVVACSHIELTEAGRPKVRDNCYTGGIDAHGARGWRVHDNTIEGFYCAQGLSEHGVHFWTGSRDTIVERNRIFNVARGVGFGLGETNAASTDQWRTYTDEPCASARPVGHYGGIVRNNFIFANDPALFSSDSGFDSGVDFEQACGSSAFHNTIFASTPPTSSAIEWRFANSSVTVSDNLANAAFKNRASGAQGTTAGNVETAKAELFVDAAKGDLHLVAPATGVKGAGTPIAAGLCDDDIDGDPRTTRDVGADQLN
jgi:hypothetical protein